MPIVIEDLERGNQIGFDLNTVSVQRVFHVSSLVSAPELQLMEAMSQPEIPNYVDLYPLPPDPSPDPDPYALYRNIAVIDRRCVPDGPSAARITVTYTNDFGSTPAVPNGSTESQDIKQIHVGVAERITSIDRNGAPMLIDPPASKAGSPPYLSIANSKFPVGTLGFDRTETSAPTEAMKSLVGKVNNAPIGSYATNTLWFTSLDANSSDNTEWRVSYEFERNEDQWKYADFWRDAKGDVPDDGEAVLFDVLPEGNFSVLNLDFD